MSVFKQMAKVRCAQQEMKVARAELTPPAAALLARGQRYPLATVGTAAGAGFVLGSLNVHPLRVPGMGALLSGGLAETVAYAARLVSELGAFEPRGATSGRSDSDGSSAPDADLGQPS
jgi:hypothetical protein